MSRSYEHMFRCSIQPVKTGLNAQIRNVDAQVIAWLHRHAGIAHSTLQNVSAGLQEKPVPSIRLHGLLRHPKWWKHHVKVALIIRFPHDLTLEDADRPAIVLRGIWIVKTGAVDDPTGDDPLRPGVAECVTRQQRRDRGQRSASSPQHVGPSYPKSTGASTSRLTSSLKMSGRPYCPATARG